jgi:hypothetical protein
MESTSRAWPLFLFCFNCVNPRAETTHWPLASPLLSAPGDGLGCRCRRVDEPTSVRKFRVAPRASYGPLDLDRLPARFRAGRSGCRGALFLLHYGFTLPGRTLIRPLLLIRSPTAPLPALDSQDLHLLVECDGDPIWPCC